MDWRTTLLSRYGPGVLSGILWRDWVRLLRTGGLAFEVPFLPRIFLVTFQAIKNSMVACAERRRFDSALESVVVQPPLFILGHWRSGTTLLHNLIAQDPRFAFPNSFQTAFPHTFLSAEPLEARLLSWWIPRTRPMDNMELSLSAPQEDEFALCAATLMSPCMAWVFPRQREKFEKYLTMRGVGEGEMRVWREAFLLFLKKLQWRCRRPLVLKSPPHTARVRLLVDMFPGAKFVHIHRNPDHVFRSSRRTFQILFQWHGLQRPSLDDLDDWVLRQGAQMYDSFFEEKSAIPKGSFHEVCFEELEGDPAGEMVRLYNALALPEFSVVEPKLREYVGSLKDYRKNVLPHLAPDLRARITHEWKAYFEEWGYAA
jgi:hypothetical protein